MKTTNSSKRGYYAYEIPEAARVQMERDHPPRYPEFIGHHITLAFGVPYDPSTEGQTALIQTYSFVQDEGIEAYLVRVNGEKYRSNGDHFHCTWSLDRSKGKKPVDANALADTATQYVTRTITFYAPLKFYPF